MKNQKSDMHFRFTAYVRLSHRKKRKCKRCAHFAKIKFVFISIIIKYAGHVRAYTNITKSRLVFVWPFLESIAERCDEIELRVAEHLRWAKCRPHMCCVCSRSRSSLSGMGNPTDFIGFYDTLERTNTCKCHLFDISKRQNIATNCHPV